MVTNLHLEEIMFAVVGTRLLHTVMVVVVCRTVGINWTGFVCLFKTTSNPLPPFQNVMSVAISRGLDLASLPKGRSLNRLLSLFDTTKETVEKPKNPHFGLYNYLI
jgi:hypothetical protein